MLAQVSALGAWGNAPAGPVGRAKGLLDALHDDQKAGPWYRDAGASAPLADDHPDHVAGLAVEVRAGDPRTQYFLGEALEIRGERLARVAVGVAAPNDIAGTRAEQAKIDAARRVFSAAVRDAFAAHEDFALRLAAALVIRHRPQRDEDNTWATWVAAACGARRAAPEHWAADAPLAGWSPASVASLADPALASPVVYEVWG